MVAEPPAPLTVSHPASLHVSSTDGVSVAVHDLGGRGRPLLVAHATGFHGRCYTPLADELAGQFHTIAPDLRGHGDTAHPEGVAVDWDRNADDVLAVAEAYGPLDAFGHSMGGACLLIAAARRPELFRRLVTFEPIVPPADVVAERADTIQRMGEAPNPLAAMARKRRPSFPSLRAAIDNYASKPPMNEWSREAIEAYVHGGFRPAPDGTVTLKCTPEQEAETFEHGHDHSAWELLVDIPHPVTVIAGVLDGTPPPAFAAAIAARLPDGTLVQRDDLDHFGPMNAPSLVAELIRTALGEARRPDGDGRVPTMG